MLRGDAMAATFLLATRGSKLALWQAETVKRLLCAAEPELTVELVVLRSTGDEEQQRPLARLGRTGVFTAEIDAAVLAGRAQAGVHSLKDLPTSLPAGLILAAVLERGAVEDVLVSRDGRTLDALPGGSRVATGSVRRVAMVRRARPDLELVGVRGNVDTRLAKLAAGEAEALVLARAGLERLGLAQHVSEVLGAPRFLPAVGQGIVGLACRASDTATRQRLERLRDAPTWSAAQAERALLAALHGGCNAPLGALARCQGQELVLDACVLAHDGREVIEGQVRGAAAQAVELGRALAGELAGRGARRLIDAARAR